MGGHKGRRWARSKGGAEQTLEGLPTKNTREKTQDWVYLLLLLCSVQLEIPNSLNLGSKKGH